MFQRNGMIHTCHKEWMAQGFWCKTNKNNEFHLKYKQCNMQMKKTFKEWNDIVIYLQYPTRDGIKYKGSGSKASLFCQWLDAWNWNKYLNLVSQFSHL